MKNKNKNKTFCIACLEDGVIQGKEKVEDTGDAGKICEAVSYIKIQIHEVNKDKKKTFCII